MLQAAMADYRQAFLDVLGDVDDLDVRFLIGEEYFDPTIRSNVTSHLVRVRPRNVYLLGRRLLWQKGVLREALSADVVIVELNPHILTSWAVAFGRRVLRRPVAAWGHAWPRQGREARTEPIRAVFRQLAGTVLLYSYRHQHEMRLAQPGIETYVVPNSMFRRDALAPVTGPAEDFVYVGRIVAEKRVDLLLEAFARVAGEAQGRLTIVGDGPARVEAEEFAEQLGIRDRVKFTGHIANPGLLRHHYSRALCAVIPGTVGLGATQALGWGVFVLYPDAGAHGPEVDQLTDVNSRAFRAGSVESLAAAMAGAVRDAELRRDMRSFICQEIAGRYSAERMANNFVEAVRAIND